MVRVCSCVLGALLLVCWFSVFILRKVAALSGCAGCSGCGFVVVVGSLSGCALGFYIFVEWVRLVSCGCALLLGILGGGWLSWVKGSGFLIVCHCCVFACCLPCSWRSTLVLSFLDWYFVGAAVPCSPFLRPLLSSLRLGVPWVWSVDASRLFPAWFLCLPWHPFVRLCCLPLPVLLGCPWRAGLPVLFVYPRVLAGVARVRVFSLRLSSGSPFLGGASSLWSVMLSCLLGGRLLRRLLGVGPWPWCLAAFACWVCALFVLLCLVARAFYCCWLFWRLLVSFDGVAVRRWSVP